MNKTAILKKAGFRLRDWRKLKFAILYGTPKNKYVWEAPGPFDLFFTAAEAYADLLTDRAKPRKRRRWNV